MRLRYSCVFLLISIHAPRTGSDVEVRLQLAHFIRISIHAPRTGSDASYFERAAFARYFNPRSPHGERRGGRAFPSSVPHFNPRSPHGERLAPGLCMASMTADFNPRSPHGDRHATAKSTAPIAQNFNPRSPHGERPPGMVIYTNQRNFNPRSQHGERRRTPRRADPCG